ncbi:hypothetical protein LG201_07485 [Methylobacillus gramineus]|uniref:hypothetical protein n=1 Tax=Methylobacillus gramineus TaxID=755169 RepID=UPI001CFF6717|nr:hypothetical protein [Methylobacillus gramineus]MCB5185044.1 hypothetical protein [Methylobacillus gramineus]
MKVVWLTLFLALPALVLNPGTLLAEESPSAQTPPTPSADSIPIDETTFIEHIYQFDKDAIVAQFGEPARKNDYHRPGTDELMASVWQYHYINTGLDGAYYQTTELDFVGDRVVLVVFMNHDGNDDATMHQQVVPGL